MYHHEVLRRSKCICTLILEHLSMCAQRNLLMYLSDIQESIFLWKIVKSFDEYTYVLSICSAEQHFMCRVEYSINRFYITMIVRVTKFNNVRSSMGSKSRPMDTSHIHYIALGERTRCNYICFQILITTFILSSSNCSKITAIGIIDLHNPSIPFHITHVHTYKHIQ